VQLVELVLDSELAQLRLEILENELEQTDSDEWELRLDSDETLEVEEVELMLEMLDSELVQLKLE
jgi:hypothetical protein